MTFRKLIPAYIDGELEDGQLNDFLIHLRSCSKCMEELEINYIVMKGVDILDHNNGDYNLSRNFRFTIEKSAAYLKKRKNILRLEYVVNTIAFWGVLLSVILYLNLFFLSGRSG